MEDQYYRYYDPFNTIISAVYINILEAYPGYWNLVMYNKDDWKQKAYLTGVDDGQPRENKRFYQVVDAGVNNFKYSIIIIETNNTAKPERSVS